MGNGSGRALDRLQPQEAMPGEQLVAQGATMERIQTGYHTAIRVQVPRRMTEVIERVLEECRLLPDGLIYSWTVNNKDGSKGTIEGASIRMAMTLAREYGNCAVDIDIDSEDQSHWTFRGTFIDAERGFTAVRLFRQRKSLGKRGKFDDDRLEDMSYQIGQSKAIRNAVVNAMPGGLLIKAQEVAKRAQARDMTEGGVQNAVQKVRRSFGKYGVKLPHLEERVGKKTVDWDGEDLSELRNIFNALEDGQTTAAQEFRMEDTLAPDAPPPAPVTPKAKPDAKPEPTNTKAKPAAKSKPEPKPQPEPDEPPPLGDDDIPDDL